MNGIHDMGGMQDMGPILIEKNEPLFHEPWEARAMALMLACNDLIPKNFAERFAIEQIPPVEYLRMSYFERWVEALQYMLINGGAIKREELTSGRPAPGSPKATPALPAAKVAAMITEDDASRLNVPVHPRFKLGQHVRARNMNPAGHTRLPRYARGKTGIIVRDQGVFAFEDSNAAGLQTNKPQHVYSVRFTAGELWGDEAPPQDTVYIDMWDDYLEHAKS
jgi:nitrile hydratase beta subunit